MQVQKTIHMNKIYDYSGIPIKTIQVNTEQQIPFTKPYFLFDILSDGKKPPRLEYHETIDILEEIGVILYGNPIDKSDSWAPRQKYVFFLRHKSLPVEERTKIIKKMPTNHLIQIDTANKLIRIIGPCISRKNSYTDWVEY